MEIKSNSTNNTSKLVVGDFLAKDDLVLTIIAYKDASELKYLVVCLNNFNVLTTHNSLDEITYKYLVTDKYKAYSVEGLKIKL